jgi:hypothetical protein
MVMGRIRNLKRLPWPGRNRILAMSGTKVEHRYGGLGWLQSDVESRLPARLFAKYDAGSRSTSPPRRRLSKACKTAKGLGIALADIAVS